jgi:hypothetical protein
MDTPQDLGEFIATYPDAHGRLISVLRPLTGIIRHTMQTEGFTWHEACEFWVNECFALCYDRYLSGYRDRLLTAPGTDFLAYCLTSFVFRVRSTVQNSRRHQSVRDKHCPVDSRELGTVEQQENHRRLEQQDCQTCKAIANEERQAELQQQADLFERIKTLDSQSSFVVWNHAALGHTYHHIAQVLGISDMKCIQLHRGAIAQLRRVCQVQE